MRSHTRRLVALAGGLLMIAGLTGCHYDYGYYSVGYTYGYDCSPRYHAAYDCDYIYASHARYHGPCDGVRFRTGYTYGHSHYRRGLPCD
ncbi:MAG: hypothetical protein ACE37H_00380 [Phycisphaeraceae bacterium]